MAGGTPIVHVDPVYHSGIRDASDRAMGFAGTKAAPKAAESLPAGRRLELDRRLQRRAPMRRIKS